MARKNTATVSAILGTFLLFGVAERAASMPDKPYSEWTDDEKTDLANQLKAKSNQDCAQYMQEAQSGGQRAAYEAAACLYGTYYLGVPDDYPNKDTYKAQFIDNANKAKALDSNAPIVMQAPTQ